MKKNAVTVPNAQRLSECFHDFKTPALWKSLQAQYCVPQYEEMSFFDRIECACKDEHDSRRAKRTQRLLKKSNLRMRNTELSSVECSEERGLAKAQWQQYCTLDWVRAENKPNLIVTGPTGCGKSHIIQCLGREACAQGIPTLYCTLGTLCENLATAQAARQMTGYIRKINRIPLLIIDDFMGSPGTDEMASRLMELLSDRYGEATTIVASQLMPEDWYKNLGAPLKADAIIDRLSHGYIIHLKGESRRVMAASIDAS